MADGSAVRVVGVSGSLRRASSNTALVEAAALLAPRSMEIAIYRDLAKLPPFNPDTDDDAAPDVVIGFRSQLRTADAVLISSPEYAHGVPGVLKNALDWIVGSGELIDTPVALINTSPRAAYAWASLAGTLSVMSARVIPGASITLPLQGRVLDARGIAGDPALSAALTSALQALAAACEARIP